MSAFEKCAHPAERSGREPPPVGEAPRALETERTHRVNVGEATRDCRRVRLVSGRTERVRTEEGEGDGPNHFLDSLAEPSMTSRTPGLSDSIEGTWLARLWAGAGVGVSRGGRQERESSEERAGDSHTEVARLGGEVDLNDVLRLEDGLQAGSRGGSVEVGWGAHEADGGRARAEMRWREGGREGRVALDGLASRRVAGWIGGAGEGAGGGQARASVPRGGGRARGGDGSCRTRPLRGHGGRGRAGQRGRHGGRGRRPWSRWSGSAVELCVERERGGGGTAAALGPARARGDDDDDEPLALAPTSSSRSAGTLCLRALLTLHPAA